MLKKYLFVGFLLNTFLGLAQTIEVQVVKKTIEERIEYANDKSIQLVGEKAEIQINTWENQHIQLTVQLISKHPDRAVAKKDMEQIFFSISELDNKVIIRNEILNEDKDIASTLLVKYDIYLPESCPVYLSNYFGNVKVQDHNLLDINTKFSSIDLERINGILNIESVYGDIYGQDIAGNIQMQTRRSDILLNRVSGMLDIFAEYGKVEVLPTDRLLGMDIDGNKSDIIVHVENAEDYNFNISNRHGKINLPSSIAAMLSEPLPNMQRATFAPQREEVGVFINISTTLGSIKVNEVKPKY